MVIRAHGISPKEKVSEISGFAIQGQDLPDVGVIAGRARSYSAKGYDVVIFVDQASEVMGLMGYAGRRACDCFSCGH